MRYSFRNQSSTAKCNSIASNSLTKFSVWVAQKTETATLLMLLGLGGGWMAVEAIAPQVAQADSQRVEISLDRQQNETYQDLVSRAEAAASTTIQRSFNQDILMKKVSVMIMGQNHGAIAPVLFLAVNRDQWSSEPNVQRWVTYFRSARSLLGFENVTTTTEQPTTSTTDTSEQPQTPTASDATGTNRTPANSGATPANTQKPTTTTTTTPSQTPSAAPDALNPSPVAPTTNSNPVPLGGVNNTNNTPNNSGIIPNNSGVIPNNSGIIPDSNPLDVPTTPNSTPNPQSNPPGFNDPVPQGTLD